MNNNDIWIIFTKSRPMDGCEIDMEGCEFYFTEVFVPAPNLSNAIDQAKGLLLKNKLELSEVSKGIRYTPSEWEKDTPQNRIINDKSNSAINLNIPQISPFRSEEIQEDMQYQHIVTELD